MVIDRKESAEMGQIRKRQILFHDGELAEFVGWYSGANKATGIPIFQIEDKYYLGQNPTAGSIFGGFARRGHPIYWELSEYPDRSKGLKYTGNMVFVFKLLKSSSVRNYIQSILREEKAKLKAIGEKPVLVEYQDVEA